MEQQIAVKFAAHHEFDFALQEADTADLTWEQAQRWIDEEYVNTGYQADYPVGMTLLVDKILRIAITYGPQPFANRTAWAKRFARCAGRAIGKINITVDVANRVVGV